jgi:4-amino-4-deoxy-L-arabinose transferase-like glycosyltransferase
MISPPEIKTILEHTVSDAPELKSAPTPSHLPEQTAIDLGLASAIFLLAVGYLWLFRRYTFIEPDEGIILQGAQRILRGEVLYRDFFSFFTPGSYYFVALIFRVFGSSIIVARTALVLIGATFSVITYLLARRVCSRESSLFVAGLVTATTLPYRFLVLHNWDSTLWACLAVYCAVRLVESPRSSWAFGVGTFVSLTFLFEQSKGAGLGLGLSLGLLAAHWGGQRILRKDALIALALGLAWTFVITFSYFGAQRSLGIMLADWFWPLRHYSLANHVPYGYQTWSDETRHALFGTSSIWTRIITALTLSPCFLVPVLPLAAAGIFGYWIVQMRRREASRSKCNYYVVMCASLIGLLLSVVIGRADIIHFMYLLPLWGLVLAWIVDGRDIPSRVLYKAKPFITAFVAIAFLLFALALLTRAAGSHVELASRRGQIRLPEGDSVIGYVQAHVAPGETMLVYPYLPLYYYLTATFSPSRYEYFQPGMHTPEQAHEMLSQLVVKRVRVVLFEPGFPQKIPTSWPGTPLSAVANDPVTDYILREYRNCKILQSANNWRFLFMVRKDAPCPETPPGADENR